MSMLLLISDDDDINDVASMAGVNVNEENARILASSSELVGTVVRSCKDEPFLQTTALQQRVLLIGNCLPIYSVRGKRALGSVVTYILAHIVSLISVRYLLSFTLTPLSPSIICISHACSLLTFCHMLSPGSERQKAETLSLISRISDKAVPLNQYANDCGVAQNCQIGKNPLHRADQNN